MNHRTKVITAIVLISILVVSAGIFIWASGEAQCTSQSQTTTTLSQTTASKSQSTIPVGAFLYLWYGNATAGAGGLGSSGWNNASYPGGGSVVDRPSIGYYVSDSNLTFQTQIGEMQSAGISFAIVSWWGPSYTGESEAINKATLDLFRYIQGAKSDFKVAIMVDAYEGGSNLSASQFLQDYAYVSSTFVQPFGSSYFHWEGKPLLLFFNPIIPNNPGNPDYSIRSIGNRPNPVQWTFWDAPVSYFYSQHGSGVNATNDEGNATISNDGEVTIVPRIDSYYNEGYQSGSYLRFDPTLASGLYAAQWSYVVAHRSQVQLVLIYSFNEYHERSEIEPHSDCTNSTVGPSYLLDLTAQYTNELNQ